jgi:undecaprenyl-diphosphatase
MAITRLGLNNPELSEKPAPLIGVILSMSLAITVLALVLLSSIASEMREGETAQFDASIRSFVHSFSSPGVTKLMFALSFMGATGLMAILAAAVILFIVKKWYRALGWLALTMAGATVLDVALKYGFHRIRPVPFFGSVPHTYSFPSGHALFSFCFYGVMAGLINARVRSHWLRVLVWFVAAVMVAGIGLSRIYLGVHYPSDVIAAYLAGTIWVSTMITMDRLRKLRSGLKVATVSDGDSEF